MDVGLCLVALDRALDRALGRTLDRALGLDGRGRWMDNDFSPVGAGIGSASLDKFCR